jgi:hypothetical protein
LRVGARGATPKDVWEYLTRTLTNLPDERAAKIDNLDKAISSIAGDTWNYPNRDLTRTQFPFWSAIITQNEGSISAASGVTSVVNIQPPTGETWLVWLDFFLDDYTAGNCVFYDDYNGVNVRYHNFFDSGGTYGDRKPHLGLLKVLTNSLYARIGCLNAAASARYFYYGYSGFKLSQPLWSPKRDMSMPALPWKRPRTSALPSSIAALDKYAWDILGVDPARPNEYALSIILEEDTPLAIDPVSGFPVERFTAVVKADVLADLIAKFKAGTLSPDATGYRKYLDKWKAEGINLGV